MGKMGRLVVLCAAFALLGSGARAMAGLAHRYSFTTDATDSVGALNGTAFGGVSFSGGNAVFDGADGSYIGMTGNDIATISAASKAVSFEFWGQFQWNGDWARAYDLGADTSNYMFHNVGNIQNVVIKTGGGESGTLWNSPGLTTNTPVHVLDVFDQNTNSVKVYLNGSLAFTGDMGGQSLANVSAANFYLGKSQYTGDSYLKGSLNEFRVWNTALDAPMAYALDLAGPDALPTIVNATTGGTTNDWNLTTTWSSAAIPDAATIVTIDGALGNSNIVLGTANGSSGAALGLTLKNAGSLTMTGATLNTFALDTAGGTLSLDATSVLTVGGPVTASGNLQGVAAASGSTINANGGLTYDAAKVLTGVNLTVKGFTVNNGQTFDPTGLGSFQLTGGVVQVTDNGTFNLNQGANTASAMSITNGGKLTVAGTALIRPSLAVSGNVDLVSWGNLSSLVVDTADVSCNDIRISHDEGARGRMIVKGNGTFTTNYVQQGFNGAMSGLLVQNQGQFTVNGNWDAGQAHNGNIQNEFRDNAVVRATGDVRLGSDNGVDWWGGDLGSTQYNTLRVAGNASFTVNGQLTMIDWTRGGASGGIYSQVYQTGGTVEVKGGNGIIMARDYESGVMQATYNLNGGELKAQKISRGSGRSGGTAQINFHGGTLTYNGATPQTDFVNLGTNGSAYVYEGATINTGGQDVTLNQPLLSPNTGSGLNAINVPTPIGSGYAVAPAVIITGGGGTGATAVATIDGSGAVTGVTVTNPGVGYSSNPTVRLNMRSNEGIVTIDPANVAIATNAFTGGLTKTGSGVLTLAGTGSTYTGPTNINQGTLRLPGTATPSAQWVADDLSGTSVTNWADRVAGKAAVTDAGAPALGAGTMNGHNAVAFSGSNQSLQVGAPTAMSNANDFTIAVAFRPAASGVGGDGQWYGNTGVVDMEQPGGTNDWGLVWNENNKVGAGLGNGDITQWSDPAALNAPHVAIYTRSGGTITLNVDGVASSRSDGGTAPRNDNRFSIGQLQTGGNFFNGEIAEIQIYNVALGTTQLNNVGYLLASTYGASASYVYTPSGMSDYIPDGSAVNVAAGAVFDLNGAQERIGSLAGPAGSSVTLGSGLLYAGGNHGNTAFNGAISGQGGLIKEGAGILTLGGANTYAGTTAVSAGTLLVNGTHTGGGLYTVSGQGTLGGTGTIGASLAVSQGGILSPGASIGRLTVGGNVALGGLLKTEVDPVGTGQVDVLDVAGLLDIADGAVDFDTLALLDDPAYIFAEYGSLGGSAFASVTDLPPGYRIDYHYLNQNQIALVQDNDIPEPATMALLGLAATGLGCYIRRRHAA